MATKPRRGNADQKVSLPRVKGDYSSALRTGAQNTPEGGWPPSRIAKFCVFIVTYVPDFGKSASMDRNPEMQVFDVSR